MKTRNPFDVNALAVEAAMAALEDEAHLARVVALAQGERGRVAAELCARGYDVAPSETNFVFFDTGGPAAGFAEALRHKGVLIKAWQEAPYTPWARVTLGLEAENDAFLAGLPAR